MATPAKTQHLKFTIGNEATLRAVKAVIAYEATIRNRSKSQTAYELVMEAIDMDSYPREVREQLMAIEDQMKRRVAQEILESDD